MLELKNIRKVYQTENFEQVALRDESVKFRKNEFVSILGPSGSGKTTCLNIIGGLDQYTSGDLIINGQSTKIFKAEDWDAYRNNTVGFIFQSYNLIGHLNILDNVEMSLTLSGVSSKERKKRAIEVLEKVGLAEHLHKKPNQLSGGQMQRVAIARALVNNPQIILADEPTGALDTATSIQIMQLIQEVAKDRLVIMVTHNAELAENYSNRIIQFSDGQIQHDSHPYEEMDVNEDYQIQHTSMNFLTALKSSGKNILTKRWRTSLTAFASSVGIIGVALVLALSNGFNTTITEYQTQMLSNYPITISNGFVSPMFGPPPSEDGKELEAYSINDKLILEEKVEQDIHENNLTEDYIKKIYALDSSLVSGYSSTRSVQLPILKKIDNVATRVNTTNLSFSTYPTASRELNTDYLKEHFDVLAGEFPRKASDLLLVVNEYNQITKEALEELGLSNKKEIAFEDVIGVEFKLLYNDDYYIENGNTFTVKGNPSNLENLYTEKNAQTLSIVGIIRLKEEATATALSSGIIYSDQLVEQFIQNAQQSKIVQAQLKSNFNVLTGELLANEGSNSQESFPESMSASSMTVPKTKDSILQELGNISTVSSISIYPVDFAAKEKITTYLDSLNDEANDEEKIEYTDLAATISSTLSTLVNTISYVLIAFASISLIVSMIMIGIIIYVSVLERTKEIGILRALGARKKDISRLFNAETFIIGLASGLIGIGITYLLTIPINIIIAKLTDFDNIASLSPFHALALVILSIILTMVGGILPSKMAAKKDPVTALRSE
ncbi:ABC transporter ATP-binding protein/permease [Lysinibacillus capsici]